MDDLLREAKERFLLEGQKVFIAINGLGAAALLTFLQAIWNISTAESLRAWVLFGIVAFAIGVAIAAATFPVRQYALNEKAFTKEHWLFRLAYWYMPGSAIIAFLLGLFLPVIGAFLAIC
jgi:hypothetical protein